jgi:hypothetical protein
MDETAGNEYQGDQLKFNIELYAEQLDAPGPAHTTRGVVLDNKDVAADWVPLVDGRLGLLTWDLVTGNYRLRAWGLDAGAYKVKFYDTTEHDISTAQTAVGGKLDFTGNYANFGVNPNAKYWLRYEWDNAKTLFESNLVN